MKTEIKSKTAWMIAVVLTGIDYIIAVLAWEMVYINNDEGGIQAALSGAWTGEPYPFHQFINVVISFPIAGLYKLFPSVQWWYVCNQILTVIGILLVHYFLLKISQKNKFPLPFVIALILFFDLGFFVVPISHISFTMVPAILGTGIVAGLFWLAEAKEVRHKKWIFAGILIGYIVLYSWRRDTGLALLCFILLALLYYFISRSENGKQATVRFLCTAVIFLVISAALTYTNRTIQNNLNGEEFVEFNSARIQYMDYPHDTYDENPELYEEVGWDRDTYNMANSWGFINERIDADSLSYIAENSKYSRDDVIEILEYLYYDYFSSAILLLFAVSLVATGVVSILFRKKKTIIFWALNNVGALVLLLYQIMIGRAIYRSIFVVLLPAVVINLMLSFRQEMARKRARNFFMIVVLILGLLCARTTFRAAFDEEYNIVEKEKKEKYLNTCEYLALHEDNFYVVQGRSAGDYNFPISTSKKQSNMIKWGSSIYYSNLFYEQLRANGLSELTGETFKQDNVFFVTSTNALSDSYEDNGNNLFASFYRTLKHDYDAAGFVLEDTIGDYAYVYHFVFEENADEYDEYYDLVDGKTVQIEPR